MKTASAPIATTTSLSFMLHATVIAATFLYIEHNVTTGLGIDILLISSTRVSDQQETEIASKINRVEKTDLQPSDNTVTDDLSNPVQQSLYSRKLNASADSGDVVSGTADKDEHAQQKVTAGYVQKKQLMLDELKSTAQFSQSTNARQQQHSLLELLHNTISNNKEYPYLARRQRREGVATVGFVLHPDGTIKNARLVNSSSNGILDRAALSAVKRIEPFIPARDYIRQAEEFKIDVVFKLL